MFQRTWKWHKGLELFKSGEVVLNSNVETTDLDAPTPNYQKLNDKLTEKRLAVLDKSMRVLNSKPEKRTEANEDIFGKMVAVTLKRTNPYQKIIAREKINDMLFEIELSDYKQQQSYSMNEPFQGPFNTSNKSDMMSQNLYSTPQATYAKIYFPVSPYDSKSSTYSQLI